MRASWLLVALLAVIPRAGWSQGDPVGPEFRVNTYTTGDQYAGIRSVAADPLGNFVVVWVSDFQDGSNRGIFGQRYNMIVPVELMLFRVE